MTHRPLTTGALLFWAALFMLWSLPLFSSNSLPDASPRLLTDAAEYWFDPHGDADLATAREAPFRSPLHARPGLDFKPLWLRVTVDNPGPPASRLLRVGPALLEQVEFWQIGRPLENHQIGGLLVPGTNGAFPGQETLFPLTLDSGSTVIYLRLFSQSVLTPYVELWQNPAWERERNLSNVRMGLTYGVFLMFIQVTLIYAGWTRKWGWMYLGLSLFCFLLYQSCYEGSAAEWLWPERPELSIIVLPASVALGVMSISLFVLDFVPMEKLYRTRRFLLGLLVTPLLALALLVFGDYRNGMYWMAWTVFIMALILPLLGVTAWRQGFRPGLYTLLALALIYWATLFRIGVIMGWWAAFYRTDLWVASWCAILATGLLIMAQARQLKELRQQQERNLIEISAARDSAARVSRSKSLLLARISHDLRTPLHTLMGYLDLAQRERPDGVMGRYVKMMIASSQKMLNLIDELLQFARGEEGRLELNHRSTFLHALIQQIDAQAETLAADYNTRFVRNIDVDSSLLVVVIDAPRLYSVLINLLSNACRATVNGVVSLSIQGNMQGDTARLRFAVQDTGPGIPLEEQARIFLPFEHGSSGTHGTGMGLTIARQLVRLMGGELLLESQPGAGALFHFTLNVPLAKEADVLPAATLTAPYGYNGPVCTLLVVDDVVENRMFMQDLLTGMGFDVRMAADLTDALEEARSCRLDGAIVDQYLISSSGWDILDALKAIHSDLPVILLSAAPGAPPATRTSPWQFDAQLLKPLRVEELTQLLGRLLNLVWRFSNADQPTSVVLQTLPSGPLGREDLLNLRQMADEGSLFEVEDWIEQWQNRPEERDFLEQITPLLATARLSAIVRLVDQRLAAGHF